MKRMERISDPSGNAGGFNSPIEWIDINSSAAGRDRGELIRTPENIQQCNEQ